MDWRKKGRYEKVWWMWVVAAMLAVALVKLYYTVCNPVLAAVEFPAVELEKPESARVMRLDGAEKAQCDGSHDLTGGSWVPDASGPLYTNHTCSFIGEGQNCLLNGKPLTDYLHWRWEPESCHLPAFDAAAFLKMLQNKVLAFVGDSIARNHMLSLHCLLAQVDKASEIFRYSENWKTMWVKFPSTNSTLVVLWAPYLVRYQEQDKGPTRLDLDVLQESWVSVLPRLDYAVFSTGPWYFKPALFYLGNQLVGAHAPEMTDVTQVDVTHMYRTALRTVFGGIKAVDGYRGISVWRTWAVEHFEGGSWSTGGTCPRTRPFTDTFAFQTSYHRYFRDLQLEEFEVAGLHLASDWLLLNVTAMAWLRPDGHPGPYMHKPGAGGDGQNDCLHWCLPGPIDTWNDWLLVKLKGCLPSSR